MSITNEGAFDIILQVGEGSPPLAPGKEIRGRITVMSPSSWPPEDRGAIIQPEKGSPPSFPGLTIFVSPRDKKRETWNDFRTGQSILVFVSLLDSKRAEIATGLGRLKRSK